MITKENHRLLMESIRRRGMSLTKIAAAMGTTHSHLSQTFNGLRGGKSHRRIALHLTASETALLGWTEQGKLAEPETPDYTALAASLDVPQGTLSHVEHTATSVAANGEAR